MIRAIVVSLGVFLATFGAARADLMTELSAADQQKVKSGGQVMVTETLEGYPWPKVVVYQYVAATPREVMAVFTDYDNAVKFVPNCLKSRVSKKVDACCEEVDYLIDVPILPDEAYTARNTLTQEAGGAYRVSWKLLKATSILESVGNLYAEPMGEGTVVRYTNLVKPSSRAAFLLRSVALSQMSETVDSIVKHVQSEKSDPATLKSQLEHFDASLGGKS